MVKVLVFWLFYSFLNVYMALKKDKKIRKLECLFY